MSATDAVQVPAGAAEAAPAAPAASPSATANLGLGTQLLLWLWPLVLVGAAVLYLQHRYEARLAVALADRPRIEIVDEVTLIRAAIARGADPNNLASVNAAVKREMRARAGADTVLLPSQVVTAAPEDFYVHGAPVDY